MARGSRRCSRGSLRPPPCRPWERRRLGGTVRSRHSAGSPKPCGSPGRSALTGGSSCGPKISSASSGGSPWSARSSSNACSTSMMNIATARVTPRVSPPVQSEEHTSELQSRSDLVCRLLLEKKKNKHAHMYNMRMEKEDWQDLYSLFLSQVRAVIEEDL